MVFSVPGAATTFGASASPFSSSASPFGSTRNPFATAAPSPFTSTGWGAGFPSTAGRVGATPAPASPFAPAAPPAPGPAFGRAPNPAARDELLFPDPSATAPRRDPFLRPWGAASESRTPAAFPRGGDPVATPSNPFARPTPALEPARTDACAFWNRGSCRFPASRCRARHACATCGDASHRSRDCRRSEMSSSGAPPGSTGPSFPPASQPFAPTRVTDPILLARNQRHATIQHVGAMRDRNDPAAPERSAEERRAEERARPAAPNPNPFATRNPFSGLLGRNENAAFPNPFQRVNADATNPTNANANANANTSNGTTNGPLFPVTPAFVFPSASANVGTSANANANASANANANANAAPTRAANPFAPRDPSPSPFVFPSPSANANSNANSNSNANANANANASPFVFPSPSANGAASPAPSPAATFVFPAPNANANAATTPPSRPAPFVWPSPNANANANANAPSTPAPIVFPSPAPVAGTPEGGTNDANAAPAAEAARIAAVKVNESPYGASLATLVGARSPDPDRSSDANANANANAKKYQTSSLLGPRVPTTSDALAVARHAAPLPRRFPLSRAPLFALKPRGAPLVARETWTLKPRSDPRRLIVRSDDDAVAVARLSSSRLRSSAALELAETDAETDAETERVPPTIPSERERVRPVEDSGEAEPEPDGSGPPSSRDDSFVSARARAEGYAVTVVPALKDSFSGCVKKKNWLEASGTVRVTLTREGFGVVRWLAPVDAAYLESIGDVTRAIRIERGAVLSYESESASESPPLPAPGEGLRGRAEVTLFGCAPREEGKTAKVEERVIRRTRKMGAEFLEYDAGKNRGTWRFVAAL